MTQIIHKEETYKIIGAAIEVHKELGHGFLEAVFQEALEIEFEDQAIPFVSQKQLQIHYKGRILKKQYIADFLVHDDILIEIKAIDRLTSKEESQVINYLNATNLKLGLLINFGSEGKLEWKRLVN
ncbi:GxxExxY protein [Pelagicoccus sp. SDUM812005]|uniref:GxxExxY protein n=1 Tax=Pelagicoccus sp. SDUM812005 TaxID=3041257 RepID=UPI00280FBA92|nr:GxxExxY protein [Pelagicoccus sp. SDUM812005]MDQ8182151.1 GxxExxY protein [Pelagicoccus sp. SDUM812005]